MAKTATTATLVNKMVKKKPAVVKPKEKPKLDPEPKKKDLKKEDPYFVQEDYEVRVMCMPCLACLVLYSVFHN